MLFPDNIESFESKGEHILYLKFKNEESAKYLYVLHSVFTNHHLKNVSGELDFLVLAPGKGIFAIEVKHGKVTRKEGTWLFENGRGNVTIKKKSPFSQVDSTLHSIRNYILSRIKNNEDLYARVSKILFGTGVAFTGMNEFIDFGTEGHSFQIFTRQSLGISISEYIETLSKGWHSERRNKAMYDVDMSRPSDKDCLLILQIIRGDFEISYSDVNRMLDHEYLINSYTKEQFAVLDFVNFNSRCLIQGQAGTGKTVMALELASRALKEGKRVALFCYNHLLGSHLHESISLLRDKTEGQYYAGTFHKYLIDNTTLSSQSYTEDKEKYYNEMLPLEFIIKSDTFLEKYDLIIIDESQDLITPYFLEVFEVLLKGGFSNGNWVLFGDFSNQALYLVDQYVIFELLKAKANYTIFPPLKINCRNTRKIAIQNTLLTGVEKPQFLSRSVDGDAIDCRFPSKNKEVDCIEDIIKEMLDRGILSSNITLLAQRRFENTSIFNSHYIKSQFDSGLRFHTIHSFKGLENSIIILFGFDEIRNVECQRLLYVGISRARQKLFIILDNSLESDYSKLIIENQSKLISNGHKN
jgi:Nuclease-related domain/UvrD-like helicase C-terminal domain/AAA domain